MTSFHRLIMMTALAVVTSLSVCPTGNALSADEFIIDESEPVASIGDFNCISSRTPPGSALPFSPGQNEITAGALWKFFNENGMTKVDKLTLCLDVDPRSKRNKFDFNDVVLTISDPDSSKPPQKFSIDGNGDNRLIVPGYEASSFKPEAEMEINLNYDFMQRYSQFSTEKIVLNFNVDDPDSADAAPMFSIAGQDSWISQPNYAILIGFTVFWSIVFVLMFRFIKPADPNLKKSKQPATS